MTIGGKAEARREYWRQKVAAHECSGLSVKRFCDEHVETGPSGRPVGEPELELKLLTGERLRIGAGIDLIFLRRVLTALRA